jgi:hypothetical protein
VWAVVVLAALRAAVVAGLHVQARRAGFVEPLAIPLATMAVQAGVTLIEGAVALWLLRALPVRAGAALVCAFALALCAWTLADPVIYTLAGDHLTPSLLAHFAGFRIFTSDYLWKPVRAYPGLVAAGVALIAASVLLAVWMYRLLARAGSRARDTRALRWLAIGAAAVGVPFAAGASHLAWPPEVLYALDALPRPAVSGADIAALRDFVGLPAGAQWADERFPLVYRPAPRPARASAPPDVIVISIESLRGQDMHWVTRDPHALRLPALEALARRGVVFPHFVSNGFPSSEGFISTSAGTWPHDRRRIVLDYKDVRFDFLSARLRSLGYRTVRVEHDPNFGEEEAWIRRAFDEWITFAPGGLPSEVAMAHEIERLVERHDREQPGRPLFIDWKTANPHMPYNMPGEPAGTPRENYPRTLRRVDAAIGGLLQALEHRSRANETVVFVLGDHSNWLESTRTTALPDDEMVWTGAILAGPPQWIGPPRRDSGPASQADLMPTVLALVGDDRPTAALGRDLLARDGRPRRAFAIRPGGLRLDENGATTLVDRRYVHGATRAASFDRGAGRTRSDDGPRLARYADTWGRLIEHHRVWDPALIEPPVRAARAAP